MSQSYGTPPVHGYPAPAEMADGRPTVSSPAAPGYAAPNAGYSYPPVPPTNTLAIASLVCAVLGLTILPIVFGHIALAQIRRRGEAGRGLAIAGLVIGYVEVAIVVGLVGLFLGGLFWWGMTA